MGSLAPALLPNAPPPCKLAHCRKPTPTRPQVHRAAGAGGQIHYPGLGSNTTAAFICFCRCCCYVNPHPYTGLLSIRSSPRPPDDAVRR